MNSQLFRPVRWLLLSVLVLSLAGCRVLQYREVQRDFEDAVRADLQRDPFHAGYERVAATLTPEYIAKLDPRLRANAWMLRGYSAWRDRDYSAAADSAMRGLKEPGLQPGSRDDVLLTLLPALVIDSEQVARLGRLGTNQLSVQDYEPAGRGYALAMDKLKEAKSKLAANTPEEVSAYYYYQHWRILQRWYNKAINRLDSTNDDRKNALAAATNSIGTTFEKAFEEDVSRIPAGNPLHALTKSPVSH